eukprot:Platyproteum_vivax@DN16108_c0_g1_i1.p1
MPRGGKGKTKKKVKEPSSEEKEDEHLRIKQEHKLFLEVAELSRDLQNVKIEQDRNSIETEKTKKVQQSINDLPEDVKLFSQAGRMYLGMLPINSMTQVYSAGTVRGQAATKIG